MLLIGNADNRNLFILFSNKLLISGSGWKLRYGDKNNNFSDTMAYSPTKVTGLKDLIKGPVFALSFFSFLN